MKKHQRILSLLLCLVMLIGILPASAYAANATAFSDVKTTDWFCEAVEYVSGAGLMSGTGFGRFSPNEQTTRGMIVTILYRLSGSPAVTGSCTFTDVAAGKYYEKPIIWAAANGIVTGTGKDTFSPDAPITREQLAAILYRYARFCGYDVSASNSLDSFTDAASVGSYALEAMQWANAAALINGSSGALRPKGNATRAEVAAILMRFCKNVAKIADSKPGSTGTIITPVNPPKPDEPDKPDQPDQPDQPDKPDEPDQPAVKGNDAYELIWDDFMFVAPNDYSVKGFSSWDCSNAMAAPKVANGGAAYTDNSKYAGVQLRRAFNAASDDLVWEFTWKAPATLTGTTIELRSGETAAIRFTMDGSKLMAQDTELCEVSTSRFVLLRVSVSPKNGTYSVETDGQTVAENLPFLNACTSVDNIYIQTTDEATGTFTLSTVRMYVGYVLHEQFLNADQGTLPAAWTTDGDVTAAYLKGTQGPDNYSAKMQNGAKLSRGVSYSDSGAWLEYQLLIPEAMDSFAAVLSDDAGNSFKIAVENGAFGYYKDGAFQKLYDCEKNLWYHIMFKQTPQGGMLYLNHKLKAEKIVLPFEKFTTITFEAGNGTAYLDDIILKDYSDYGSDYVAEPVKPEKEAGTPLVGLQSCNLWVEGQHFGYDWLTQWDERTPYLGYYDETSAETADWELKWKIEHGIDFELFCWYIRIRIKTTVPDQKMSVAAQYFDDEQNKKTVYYDNLPVMASEGSNYTEVLVDLSKYEKLEDGYVLERIGLFPFGRSNTAYAGKTLYIGSIEFLKKADPAAEQPVKVLVIGNSITQHDPSASLGWLGNWGMAATDRTKDYVHLLAAKAQEAGKKIEVHAVNISEYEKYFYDWSKVTTDFSKYVEYDADIIISTFGANVKNGANEGDPGYENDETFTRENYKAIVDHFNPNGDAKVIAGATMLTNDKIVSVIREAADAYGYTFVDMASDLTGEEYTAKNYESALKERFGVKAINEGVLKHPGNLGMQEMADRLWLALNPLLADAQPSEEILKEYTFSQVGRNEGWSWGGNVVSGSFDNFDGESLQYGLNSSGGKLWSPTELGIDLSKLTKIRLRIKTNAAVENPTFKLDLLCGSGSVTASMSDISMKAGSDGWADITIDCTKIDWKSETVLNRICIWPYNNTGADEIINLDLVQFIGTK